jgi:hypothetical protein
LSFEDDRLFPLDLKDLDTLLDAYYELYPGKKNEKVYPAGSILQIAPAKAVRTGFLKILTFPRGQHESTGTQDRFRT